MQTRRTATDMPTSLRGIANRARRDKKARFGGLYRLLNQENLRGCFYQLRRSAAPGVDQVTFEEYERELDSNLANLVKRLKEKQYRAKLVRRKYIPKANGKLRPLGIPALEDRGRDRVDASHRSAVQGLCAERLCGDLRCRGPAAGASHRVRAPVGGSRLLLQSPRAEPAELYERQQMVNDFGG